MVYQTGDHGALPYLLIYLTEWGLMTSGCDGGNWGLKAMHQTEGHSVIQQVGGIGASEMP